MEKVKLWWNFIKYSTKLDGEAANSLRMYYLQCCKEQSTEFELPKKNFGPTRMCSHCGSLWNKNKLKIKIIPGKSYSKSVKRIIKAYSMNNQISKFSTTLMKKSIKNQMNKITIKCSVCSQNTEVRCNKPKRLKPFKTGKNDTSVSISQKKKKKRKKDKTAGLNLSNIKSPDVNEKKEILPVNLTPTTTIVKSKRKEINTVGKVRKLSLIKLNYMLNQSKVSKSKNDLSNFLEELY